MASPPDSAPSAAHAKPNNPLLGHILNSFSATPIPHPLTFTLLSSQPKSTKSLFPYAVDAPKCWVQEILLVVAVDVHGAVNSARTAGRGEELSEALIGRDAGCIVPETGQLDMAKLEPKEHEVLRKSSGENNEGLGVILPDTEIKEEQKKRIILCALEAYIYTIPSTSTTIIYISKVDSTGYSPLPHPTNAFGTSSSQSRLPPTTRTLLTSFLTYFLSPSPGVAPHQSRKIHIQLFARSQNQYLFPNSILGGGKKVGGGAKLCKWWKGVMENVAIAVGQGIGKNESVDDKTGDDAPCGRFTMKLTHLLPSYDANEARALLGGGGAVLPDRLMWTYGPPNAPDEVGVMNPFPASQAIFNEKDTPTSRQSQEQAASGAERQARRNIARLIPVFEDDPKARFLYEIVESASGASKKRRTQEGKESRNGAETDGAGASGHGAKRRKLQSDLSAEGDEKQANEYQEQAIGVEEDTDLTGPSASDTMDGSGKPAPSTSISDAHREKRKLEALNLRRDDERALAQLSFDKFWELIGYRQECASGDVTGFFSMSRVPVYSESTRPEDIVTAFEKDKAKVTPKSRPDDLSQEVFARLLKSLLNYDFANRDLAIVSSEGFLRAVKNIVTKEIGQGAWEGGCTGRVERNAIELPPRAGGQPDANGGKTGDRAEAQAPTPIQQINVLQVRKKRKPVPA